MSSLLLSKTALRTVLPAVASNPLLLTGASAFILAIAISKKVNQSGGIEEINASLDGFKAKFYPPQY